MVVYCPSKAAYESSILSTCSKRNGLNYEDDIEYNEIQNSKQYNERYKVKVGRKKHKDKNLASDVYKSWSEKERLRWATSYRTFIDCI